MNAYDFVHLVLHAVQGEIKGKTKLQKTVYFLGEMTDCLGDLGYRAHYYGPYSPDVAAAVNRLRLFGFVDQRAAGGGAINSLGFEVVRYDFSLTKKGRHVAEQKAERHPELWKKLQGAAATLEKAGDLDYVKLSVAAKTYFMLGKKRGRASFEELAELAKRFDWSVSSGKVKDAANFLSQLGLVTLSSKS